MRDFSLRFLLSLATALLVKAQQLNLGQTAAPLVPVTAATAVPLPQATVPPATAPPVTAPPETTPAVAEATTAPEEEGWPGCVNPAAPDELVRIGKQTTICIVLGSSTVWNVFPATRYLRLSFTPQADQYSRFHVPSCELMLWSQ